MRPSMRAPSATPMARANTPTKGLKMLVAASRIAVIEGALNWGVGHLLILTTYHSWPIGLEQDGRNRTAGARRLPAPATTAPCMSRKQRDEPRNDVRHDRQRRRIEHVSRLYHSRPTLIINRSATTATTTTASMTKSDSATIPPVYRIQHEQRHTIHEQLDDSALILHSAILPHQRQIVKQITLLTGIDD